MMAKKQIAQITRPHNITITLMKLKRFIHKYRSRFYIVWNRIKFKLYSVEYGKNFKVYNKIDVMYGKGANIKIGDNFTFTSGNHINPLARNIQGCIRLSSNATLRIGNDVGISSSCIWSHQSIIIGNNVKIGGDTILIDSDAHSMDYLKRRNYITDSANKINSPITIEDDAFIGTRSIILKGVTIGARSIIGAGSVVTKSIPADCIAAGNPAKVVKYINRE